MDGGRQTSEIIGKTLLIHITTVAAFGHLNSLRQASATTSLILQTFAFVVCPLYLPMQILQDILAAFRYGRSRKPFPGYCFYISIMIGINAITETNETIPLRILQKSEFQRETPTRTSIWYGKVVMLLFFLVQAVVTIILFVRRLQVQGGCYWIDNRNGLIAICGALAGILSLMVQLLNLTWRVTPSCTGRALARFHHEPRHYTLITPDIHAAAAMHLLLGYNVIRPWEVLPFLHNFTEDSVLRRITYYSMHIFYPIFVLVFSFFCRKRVNLDRGISGKDDPRFRRWFAYSTFYNLITQNITFLYRQGSIFGDWKDPWAEKLVAF
ncbi:hypothetical protein BDD12DRAFT_44150 [Trichophaea hybrida]|nr:hypothetical protein BDD12DRAFT_44150 [Trichophaea hybrida]